MGKNQLNAQSQLVHVVQRGETLMRIAEQYQTDITTIAEANGIQDINRINVGQSLIIPVSVADIGINQVIHIVRAGESVQSIAELYGITLEELLETNPQADSNNIIIGQSLYLDATIITRQSPIQPLSIGGSSENSFIHYVQSGETLFKIAQQYDTTVNDLATLNQITDPTLITVNQPLLVPGIALPEVALDVPAIITSMSINPLLFVEGETAQIVLTTNRVATISGEFLQRSLNVATDPVGTTHRILVGIPIFTETGVYPLTLRIADGATYDDLAMNIQVISGGYGQETIQLIEGREELLTPAVEEEELNLLRSIVATFNGDRYFNSRFSLPAAASLTSAFGTRRSYNGGAFDRFHSGADFAGVPGTPILAPSDGQVVMVDTLNIRGKATLIDHGWGVYTGYWHQNDIYVQLGERVQTGQVIGTIGSTGRVTGAHLHWELWVNGVPTDPMQWVQESFSP
ncbi:MAG: LysM peptidoglycan-binding domain-containing protein [Phototrophicaceae bacterium]